MKAAELISFENLTPEERMQAKNKEAGRIAATKIEMAAESKGKNEATLKIAQNMLDLGLANELISAATGLTLAQIQELREEKR
jgi:hypothetical protein